MLTDESLMPYGKHKGTKMANVPADYLLYLYRNEKCSDSVKVYVHENYDVLVAEAGEKQEKDE